MVAGAAAMEQLCRDAGADSLTSSNNLHQITDSQITDTTTFDWGL
jgi:hypothetical protein